MLRLLSSRKNQAILGLLTIEPSYPRRLAEMLKLSEADVARQLRRMKRAGLVSSQWAQIGQNVKLYRLNADRFKLRIAEHGVDLDRHEDEEVADDRRWALMEDERGDILYHRGDLEGALGHYDGAISYFRKQDDEDHLADLAWKRALTLSRLGRQADADAAREEGLRTARKGGLTRQRLEEMAERAGRNGES